MIAVGVDGAEAMRLGMGCVVDGRREMHRVGRDLRSRENTA